MAVTKSEASCILFTVDPDLPPKPNKMGGKLTADT